MLLHDMIKTQRQRLDDGTAVPATIQSFLICSMTNGAAKQYPEEQEQFNENIFRINGEPHKPTQKYFLFTPGNVLNSLGLYM